MFADRRVYLLILSCLLGGSAVAQRLAAGYVVLTSGDTIRGAIRLSSPIEQQMEVKFIPLAANQLFRLTPAKLRSYEYVYGEDTVRYVACPIQLGYPVIYRTRVRGVLLKNPVNDTVWLLLKQIMAGPVQLYERYDRGYGSRGSAQSMRQFFLRKGKSLPVNTYWWNFPKDAAAFFNDHPFLTTRLQTRRYHARDLKTVVQLYNDWQLSALKPPAP
ncbi:MAG: hypothetical protein H7Z21_02955 [Hymenobacter sp.]|nr:hypothetical protein [Hymenobacter sp.]